MFFAPPAGVSRPERFVLPWPSLTPTKKRNSACTVSFSPPPTHSKHVPLKARFATPRKSTITTRQREIAICRIGWLHNAKYEWHQHVRVGKLVGLQEADA